MTHACAPTRGTVTHPAMSYLYSVTDVHRVRGGAVGVGRVVVMGDAPWQTPARNASAAMRMRLMVASTSLWMLVLICGAQRM